ncbi:MAG: hypothetical protein WC788_01670 [Candidatus Paceibacterota bacterium]|jgi:hypothetical protein
MKKIKLIAIGLVLLSLLTSILLFAFIENYNRSDVGRNNSNLIQEFDKTGDSSKCNEIVQLPMGMKFYDSLFNAVFALIVVSLIAVVIMYLFEIGRMGNRERLMLAMAMILALVTPFIFILFSFYASLIIAGISIFLFSMLKISLSDKFIFIFSPYLTFLSYWIFIGSWYNIESLFKCFVS